MSKLTIIEGCDGSGKTTFAKAFAEKTDTTYVHFGPLPNVKTTLHWVYIEAMLPVLRGEHDVVFDRSWLSEMPYGVAFRNGELRVDSMDRHYLEALASCCHAVVVKCQPSWETVEKSFIKRKGEEYLKTLAQLRLVYDLYEHQVTTLPTLVYNFEVQKPPTPYELNVLRGVL